MPMPELATQVTPMLDYALQVFGFGSLGGLGIMGFTKLRTEVRLYRAENQKDHKVIFEKLDDMNGVGRENTTAIAKREAVCKERHG